MNDTLTTCDTAAPVDYHPAIDDPLVATGIVLQFAADFISYVGGIISTVISLLWPQRQQDAWAQIKEKVKALVDEEIDDEEWNNLRYLINEFKDKVSEFSSALTAGNYESAKMSYTTLTGYFIGIDERFKIAGHKVSYIFSPLYCLTVSLILSFRFEVIQHVSQLQLDQQLIDAEKTKLQNLLSSAIDYLSTVAAEHTKYVSGKLNLLDAGEAANDENIKNINSVFQFNQYYLTNVSIFIQIWEAFHQPSPYQKFYRIIDIPGYSFGCFL